MRFMGTVTDISEKKVLESVRLRFSVDDTVLMTLFTDDQGMFQARQDLSDYLGKELKVIVHKEGFEDKELSYEVVKEETKIEVELVPETIEFIFTVMNEGGRPLGGVAVTLQADSELVDSCYSSEEGIARFQLIPGLKNRRLRYKAELKGFERAQGDIQITIETEMAITLRKRPPKPVKGKRLRAVIKFLIGIIITLFVGLFLMLLNILVLKIGGRSESGQWGLVFAIIVWLSGGILTIVISRKTWKGK